MAETVARTRQEGYRAFKVKIGFGREQDEANIRAALGSLLPGERCGRQSGLNPGTGLRPCRACADILALGGGALACDRPAAEGRSGRRRPIHAGGGRKHPQRGGF